MAKPRLRIRRGCVGQRIRLFSSVEGNDVICSQLAVKRPYAGVRMVQSCPFEALKAEWRRVSLSKLADIVVLQGTSKMNKHCS